MRFTFIGVCHLCQLHQPNKIGQVETLLGSAREIERTIVTRIHWQDKRRRKAANQLREMFEASRCETKSNKGG